MDNKELEKILTEYIRRFDEFNSKPRNEGYKWRAIAHFQQNWNIDADRDSFLQMFKTAMAEQTNLFDGQNQHPLGGIRKLLRYHDAYDFIHQQFSSLFSNDGGNLDQRQERAQLFAERVSKQVLHFYPTDKPSTHSLYNAINYLSFWKPEENFICKPRSANKVANVVDFSGDIGEGDDFSLSEYYRMCNEILAYLDNFPEILELNETRRQRESPELSDTASRHILVYDIIYCAYKDNLNDTYSRPSIPWEKRRAIAEARKKQEAKEAEIATLQERLRKAEASIGSLPDLSGQTVKHKTRGKGIVQSCSVTKFIVNFPSKGETIPFDYSMGKDNGVQAGFITLDNDSVAEEVRSVFKRKDEIDQLKARISSAEKELDNLK